MFTYSEHGNCVGLVRQRLQSSQSRLHRLAHVVVCLLHHYFSLDQLNLMIDEIV